MTTVNNLMMKNNVKAFIALIITMILWASAFVGIRYIMSVFSGGSLALTRYMVASITTIFPFIFVKNKKMPNIKDLLSFAFLGFCGFFAYNIFLNEGEKTVNAGLANFIVSQLPIIVTILAIILYKERINRYGVLGFIVSLIGGLIILFSSSNSNSSHAGVIFIYGAAFSGAIYSCLQKKMLMRYHPFESVSYCIWFGTLMLMIYSVDAFKELQHSAYFHLLVIVYMGIFPGAIAYLLWGYSFKYIAVSKAVSMIYIMPIITLLLSTIFLKEIPTIYSILGGFIALIGAGIITFFGSNRGGQ